LTYECFGGEDFLIHLSLYRDCNCTGCADFDQPAYLTFYDDFGFVVLNPTVNLLGRDTLEISTDGLCIETAPDVCVELGTYALDVTLPADGGNYYVVYQRCCRNNTIVNIVDPGGTGNTYFVTIPAFTADDGCTNNSAIFNNFPPILVCANSPLVFDHSAFDLDGDSLSYSLCTPLDGASPDNPMPLTAPPPPYDPILWLNPPYSELDMLGGTPPLSIDPETGELTAFPETVGQFVVGICVYEYRDGVLINVSLRDFQFNVAACEVVLTLADINGTKDTTVCPGASVQLNATAFNGTEISWSPKIGLDNANILNPIATPTSTTTYTITLTNPLTQCFDTDEVTIIVAEFPAANAGADITLCPGDIAQLQALSVVGAVYKWSPETGLSNPNIANPKVTAGTESVTYTLLVTSKEGCEATDQITVTIGGGDSQPGTMPEGPIYLCEGGSVDVATSGALLNGDDVLAYVLHTSANDVLGIVLAINTSGGVFSKADNPDIKYQTVYYVSAVVGPQGSTPGVPDFNNGCTKIAPGTPIVFLTPVEIIANGDCDWGTGDYTLVFSGKGGLPEYLKSGNYTFNGFASFSLGWTETQNFLIKEGEAKEWALTVEDELGCSGQKQEAIICTKTPIELLDFSGLALENGNQISWATATETNSAYFILERSIGNASQFTPITKQAAKGKNFGAAYKFIDTQAPNGISYYRLLEIDVNNKTSIVASIFVTRTQTNLPLLQNLGNSAYQIQTWGEASFELYNASGKVLVSKHQTQPTKTQMSLNQYGAGIYYLQITCNGYKTIHKLVAY